MNSLLETIDKGLEKISDFLNKWSRVVLGFVVAGMFSAVILQVTLRYVFNAGLRWPEEATVFLMAWMTFLGSAVAIKQMEHINIDLFVEKLSEKGRFILRFITKLMMLAFIIFLVYFGFKFALNSMNFTSNALGISLFWPRLSISAAASIMVIHMLHFIVRDIRGVLTR